MSKAEDIALKKYPKKIEWVGNQWDGAPFDVNSESRVAYKQGYQQAEKDLKLTLEDIETIGELRLNVALEFIKKELESPISNPLNFTKEDVCQEVLKRFKEKKENG